MWRKKIILALILLSTITIFSQDLQRRATFDANIAYPDNQIPGARILEIESGSPLDKADIRVGDIIIKVNQRSVITQEDWGAVLFGVRAGQNTILEIKRGNELLKISTSLNALSFEKNEGVETFYESVTSDYGLKQRAIITKPKGNKKLSAIILLQGLSCSSVEQFSNRSNNWVKLIKDLAEKSNMVLMRIEKPGVGDSEGNCGKVDFKAELNGYEAAVKVLKQKPYVDASKIIVYGNSMGSALAPYIANKFNLAGIISDGTFFKSWFEHMLEIERRILQIEEKKEADISTLMNEVYIPLYYEMLIKKRSFDDILKDNPTFKKYHRHGLHHMYGRSMEYYHQVQDFNFAKHWEEVKVPIRIRWGTNDWIMTENDNDMIINILNKNGHEDHELFKYPKLDHWSTIHPDYNASFNFKPGQWEEDISQQIIDWAWEIVDKK